MPAESLIRKWLSGEASPEEAAIIDTWVKSDPSHKQMLDRLWDDYQRISAIPGPSPIPDPGLEWKFLKDKIKHMQPAPGPQKMDPNGTRTSPSGKPIETPGSVHGSPALRIGQLPRVGWSIGKWGLFISSAAILAGVTLTFILNQQKRSSDKNHAASAPSVSAENQLTKRPPIVQYSHDSVLHLTLPGNIVVILNEEGMLQYPADSSRDWQITVSGNAVIQTVVSSRPPFPVHAGKLTIQAERNNFYVFHDATNGLTIVQALKGALGVSDGKSSLRLEEGHGACYNERQRLFVDHYIPDINSWSYATHVFTFVNAPLQEVLNHISKAYGIRFTVSNPALLQCRITTQFDNESLNYILDVLAETLTIRYEFRKNGKMVYISGKGCD
jgi:ferric-dicitrate binding protein FerR (iron transport regulator)